MTGVTSGTGTANPFGIFKPFLSKEGPFRGEMLPHYHLCQVSMGSV
jgi:hypothetical protein